MFLFLYIYIINQKLEKIKHKIKNFYMWRKIILGTHSARYTAREVRTGGEFLRGPFGQGVGGECF